MKSTINRDYYIKIEKRSELICPVQLNLTEDSIILSKELESGIFIGNTIVPGSGITHVKFLNTTDEDVILKNVNFEIEPLNKYVFLTKSQNNKDRFSKLLQTLKIDNTDSKATDELINIFKDYQDIFHLEGDVLTANNFYTQHLNLTDETPVYIKNYRLPQTQVEEIDQQV